MALRQQQQQLRGRIYRVTMLLQSGTARPAQQPWRLPGSQQWMLLRCCAAGLHPGGLPAPVRLPLSRLCLPENTNFKLCNQKLRK